MFHVATEIFLFKKFDFHLVVADTFFSGDTKVAAKGRVFAATKKSPLIHVLAATFVAADTPLSAATLFLVPFDVLSVATKCRC